MSQAAAGHFERGKSLLNSGDLAGAMVELRSAVQLAPTVAEVHFVLGMALERTDALDDALSEYRKALDLKPSFAPPYEYLAKLLDARGKTEEAIEVLKRSLGVTSDPAQAHARIAVLRLSQNRLAEAIGEFELAIAIKPDHAAAHFTYAMTLLLSGDFERGWREYEWRWKWPRFRTPDPGFPQPRWDGSDIRGKTILLWSEQGFGDAIHFSRYATLVAQKGARVILAAPTELASLFRTIEGVDSVVVPGDQTPPFDVHSPLMSLPRLCGTSVETIPGSVPYLVADVAKVGAWGERIGEAKDVKRIGLVWAGDTQKDFGLADLKPLASASGVRFFSLQKGSAAKQMEHAAQDLRLVDLSGSLHDFGDTAAAMQVLDLIITTDTSVAHLAGALARPVWTLLPFSPDFRWFLDRSDSPWYPTMRLFRQTNPKDWSEPIGRIAEALKTFAEGVRK